MCTCDKCKKETCMEETLPVNPELNAMMKDIKKQYFNFVGRICFDCYKVMRK